MISFSIDIRPRPAPRPRFFRGRTYQEKWYVAYRDKIAQAYTQHCGDLKFGGNISLEITCRKSKDTKLKQYGDADNLAKAVMDALTGYAYNDDAQIVDLTVHRVTSNTEGLDINIFVL